MSGSLYPYTPYRDAGQPTSSGSAFREGFLGAQQIESNVQEMERRRQAARLAELQEQRSQAAEARAAERFPLEMKQTAFGVQQRQELAPLERRFQELRLRDLETTIQERGAAAAAARSRPEIPQIDFGGFTAPAPAPTAGVAVPPAAPAAAPAPVPAPAAAPATPAAAPLPVAPVQQSSADGRPSWMSAGLDESRRYGGVQLASTEIQPGMLPASVIATATGAPATEPAPEQGAYTGRPTSTMTDRELRDIIRAATPGGGGPAVGALAVISPEARAALVSEARLTLAQRAQATPAERAVYTAGGVGAPFETPTAGTSAAAAAAAERPQRPTVPEREAIERYEAAQSRGVVTAADRAVAANTPPSTPYLTQPMQVYGDLNRLRNEYADIQQRYRIAVASRDVATQDRLIQRTREIQQEVNLLRGMDAIIQFRSGNDAPLATAISQATGGRMQIQRAPNGTYNIFNGGQQVNSGVSREQIEVSARGYFDTQFRQEVQQARTQRAELALLQARENIQQMARARADSIVEEVKQRLRLSAPDLDARLITDQNGQQSLLVFDKRTGETVSGARITQVPPPPGSRAGTAPSFTIQPITVAPR